MMWSVGSIDRSVIENEHSRECNVVSVKTKERTFARAPAMRLDSLILDFSVSSAELITSKKSTCQQKQACHTRGLLLDKVRTRIDMANLFRVCTILVGVYY